MTAPVEPAPAPAVSMSVDVGPMNAGPTSSEYPRPRDAVEAARQFEALLIGQMLRTAHQSGSDASLGSGEDAASDTMWDVSAQQFAQVLANNGGLGLARLIAQGLKARESSAPTKQRQPASSSRPAGTV
jgi:Rod binding domain-containing protein